jgi:hypothetical protein
MTILQYALVRIAAQRMEPEDLEAAMKLAAAAEEGVRGARRALELAVCAALDLKDVPDLGIRT